MFRVFVYVFLACAESLVSDVDNGTCVTSLLQTSLRVHHSSSSPASKVNSQHDIRPGKSQLTKPDSMVGKCFERHDKASAYQPAALFSPGDAKDCKLVFGGECPPKIDARVLTLSGGPWFGMYNAAVTSLPETWTSSHPDISSARYVMTMRRDGDQCKKHVSQTAGNVDFSQSFAQITEAKSETSPAKVVLLDGDYCVLATAELKVTGMAERVAQDIRLFVYDGALYASYVLWVHDRYRKWGKGLWLAPMEVHSSLSDGLNAYLDSSRAVRLGVYEQKNYGLFKYQTKMMAVTWINFGVPGSSEGLLQTRKAKDSWWKGEVSLMQKPDPHKWHNSVNFLEIPNGEGDFLGIMHIHRDQQSVKHSFDYGYAYVHRFFKMSGKPPFEIKGVSEEFCFQDVDGKCESIQMVMSMFDRGNGEVGVSYGVNDCESKLAIFDLQTILAKLMEPLSKNPIPSVREVPALEPLLLDLAELVNPAGVLDDKLPREESYAVGLEIVDMKGASERYTLCRQVAGSRGSGHYGKWPVCLDWLPAACVVYEFGIHNDWRFSDGMASRHGCQVHAFDPAYASLKGHQMHRLPNVTFHFGGLSKAEALSAAQMKNGAFQKALSGVVGPLQSLDSIMGRLGHSAVDVLKVDCGGCEWESLVAMVRASSARLACVRVLLAELHFAKQFSATNMSLIHAAEFNKYLLTHGWKAWFAVQRPFHQDRQEEELPGWRDAGGDSSYYNLGLVNLNFDQEQCRHHGRSKMVDNQEQKSMAFHQKQTQHPHSSCEDSESCAALSGDGTSLHQSSWNTTRGILSLVENCPRSLNMCGLSFRDPAPFMPMSLAMRKDARTAHRPFLLHFHKCGGTSLCESAKRAKPDGNFSCPNCNCNNWWVPTPNSPEPCREWSKAFVEQNSSMIVMEPLSQQHGFAWQPKRDLCINEFSYMAILRHPLARIHSALCQHEVGMEQIMSLLDLEMEQDHAPVGLRKCNGNRIQCSGFVYDNFYIRALLGPPVSTLPIGHISAKHLEQAAALLEQFSIVILLENPDDFVQLQSLPLFAGFPFVHSEVHKLSLQGECSKPPTRKQLARLAHLNRFDNMLYKFAAKLAEQRRSASLPY